LAGTDELEGAWGDWAGRKTAVLKQTAQSGRR